MSAALAPSAPAVSARDLRWTAILEQAARLFAAKGYEGASLRDLACATGISLGGLYHYFASKEALLYGLQKHTLDTVFSGARAAAAGQPPRAALEAVVANHLAYFLANRAAMKVLTCEAEMLTGDYGAAIGALKHRYYELILGLVAATRPLGNGRVAPRTAAMSLFGMLNWIYTWHRERRDLSAAALAAEMTALFLDGWSPAAALPPPRKRSPHGHRYPTPVR